MTKNSFGQPAKFVSFNMPDAKQREVTAWVHLLQILLQNILAFLLLQIEWKYLGNIMLLKLQKSTVLYA